MSGYLLVSMQNLPVDFLTPAGSQRQPRDLADEGEGRRREVVIHHRHQPSPFTRPRFPSAVTTAAPLNRETAHRDESVTGGSAGLEELTGCPGGPCPAGLATGLVTPVGQPAGAVCARGWGVPPCLLLQTEVTERRPVCGENTSGRAEPGGSRVSQKALSPPLPSRRADHLLCAPQYWAPGLLHRTY